MTRAETDIANAEGSYRDITELISGDGWMTCKVGRQGVPLLLKRRETFAGLRDVESYYSRMKPHLEREGLWPSDVPMPELDWSGDRIKSWHTSKNGGTIAFSQSAMEEISVLHELTHHLHQRKPREKAHGETFMALYVATLSVCIAPDAGLALSIFVREYAERKS